MLLKEKKLDPRIIRTRRDLAASLCTLMREKPFSQITVQKITEQATINRATFYAHFEDKYKLLEYMVRGAFQEKLESKVGTCERFTAAHLHLLMLATCEFLKEFDDKYAPRHGHDHPPIERQIQPHIDAVLLRWAQVSEINSAEWVATSTSWMVFGTALAWSRGERRVSAETVTDQTIHLLTQGIAMLSEVECANG